jgi:hypothetical protein
MCILVQRCMQVQLAADASSSCMATGSTPLKVKLKLDGKAVVKAGAEDEDADGVKLGKRAQRASKSRAKKVGMRHVPSNERACRLLSVYCRVSLLLPRVELVHEAGKLLQAQLKQPRALAGNVMSRRPTDMTLSTR